MAVEGESVLQIDLIHKGKGDAIGKGPSLVGMASEDGFCPFYGFRENMHRRDGGTALERVQEMDSMSMRSSEANQGQGFVDYVVVGEQQDCFRSKPVQELYRVRMMLIAPVMKSKPGAGIDKQSHLTVNRRSRSAVKILIVAA